MSEVFFLLAGLTLLVIGGEFFVRGAANLARIVGLAPLVIGLTVVAFGTSAPELGVSIKAALSDNAGLALGNVTGSNIFNVLVILGLAALVAPLKVQSQLVRLDVPVMIGASVLMLAFALNGAIGRGEGTVLVLLALVYTVWLIRQGLRAPAAEADDTVAELPARSAKSMLANLFFLCAGLGVLVLGSDWTVRGAVGIAEALSVSERLIGLTIVAAGTSLPELVTSVVATVRGERDLAVGNVVGSNIFNVLLILGATASVAPQGLEVGANILRFDLPMALIVALLCLPVFLTGRVISRREGTLFVFLYAIYLCVALISAGVIGGIELLAG